MPQILKTAKLSRVFKRGQQEIRAVDEIDISIDRGEFIAITGASGSGKSTLLNLMAGFDTPDSGNVIFETTALDSMSRRDLARYRARYVGMIFQSFNLIPHLSAFRNVEMALYFNDTPRQNRKPLVEKTLDRLGLGDRMEHRPAILSGGEQQRVAIARALVKEPEILFADEPTGNLDQDNTEQTGDLLRELNAKGLTVIMVTHDQDLARRYARRIINLHYGRITEDYEITPTENGS
jgi:ABC-type lipoprotein export system ATPase subunit